MITIQWESGLSDELWLKGRNIKIVSIKLSDEKIVEVYRNMDIGKKVLSYTGELTRENKEELCAILKITL